jgi:hypothetical protein
MRHQARVRGWRLVLMAALLSLTPACQQKRAAGVTLGSVAPPRASAPLNVASSSPPSIASQAAPPESPPESPASDAPILTPDVSLAPAPTAATATVCPTWVDSADTARSRIERLAARGDACGKAALARRLVDEAPRVANFRRALRLTSEAEDAGARVGLCPLYQLAHDFRRLARCYELIGDHRALSLEYVTGRTLSRDLERARRELERDESKDCGYTAIVAMLEAEGQTPTSRVYDFCRDLACTTLDLNGCGSDANFRYRWTSAVLRQRVIDVLDAPGRAAFARVERDFMDFVDADSFQAYYRFIGGTVRNEVALSVTADQEARFDATLEQLVVRRSIAPHTAAELSVLRAELAALDRDALRETISMNAVDTNAFHLKYRLAAAAYQRFESAWVQLATRVLGDSAETEHAARALVLRSRIELLKESSNFLN